MLFALACRHLFFGYSGRFRSAGEWRPVFSRMLCAYQCQGSLSLSFIITQFCTLYIPPNRLFRASCSPITVVVINMGVPVREFSAYNSSLIVTFAGPRSPRHRLRNRQARIWHLHIAPWPQVHSTLLCHIHNRCLTDSPSGIRPASTSAASARVGR